jgi:hypothetical protein
VRLNLSTFLGAAWQFPDRSPDPESGSDVLADDLNLHEQHWCRVRGGIHPDGTLFATGNWIGLAACGLSQGRAPCYSAGAIRGMREPPADQSYAL